MKKLILLLIAILMLIGVLGCGSDIKEPTADLSVVIEPENMQSEEDECTNEVINPTENTAEPNEATTVETKPKKPSTSKPTSKPSANKPTPTQPIETTEPVIELVPSDPTAPTVPNTETIPGLTETTTPTEPPKYEQDQDNNSNLIYLGNFRLTAYCGCSGCNGKWAGQTSTGVKPVAGRTIAVDPKVIPYGSKVVINGHTYTAEDCGGGIKGKRIDIFFSSHSETIKFGVRYADVYIKK